MLSSNALTRQINAYIAILFITVAGAGASLLIVHIAIADTSSTAFVRGADYSAYLQTVPKHP